MANAIRIASSLILFPLVAAATSLAGGDVKINSDAPGTVQNEVRLATKVNMPAMSQVVVYNDSVLTGNSPLGVSWTIDGGVTWTDTQLSTPADPFVVGSLTRIFDPAVAYFGDFYAAYIATTTTTGGSNGLYVESSTDGGMTWSGPQVVAADAPAIGSPDPSYRFNDRVHMASATSGFLELTWIKDVGLAAAPPPPSDIYYAFSVATPTLTFSAPVIVNDNAGLDLGNAPHVAPHPGGTTYVAWIDLDVSACDATTATIMLDKTTIPPPPMTPPSFGVDTSVLTIDPLPRFLSDGSGNVDARSGSYPVVGIHDGDGTGNNIYITYAADPDGAGADEADIFFITSSNGGTSWSTPLRVNDDATTNDQFHPVMVVRQTDIAIAWYDKRNSANDDSWDVYLARSTNGGTSFSTNVRVSDATFPTPTTVSTSSPCVASPFVQPWLGEYMGIDTDGLDIFMAFTKRVTDQFGDVYFDKIPLCATEGITFCSAKTTSQGCVPFLSVAGIGLPSPTDTNAFNVRGNDHVVSQGGILVYGFKKANLSFHGGKLCVKLPTRTAGKLAKSKGSVACTVALTTGRLVSNFNLRIQGGADPMLTVGAKVSCQWQQRDPSNTIGGFGDNLSDGLRFTICP